MSRSLSVPSVLVMVIAATAALYARQPGPVAAVPVTLALPDRANATPWIAAQGTHVAVVWAATASGSPTSSWR